MSSFVLSFLLFLVILIIVIIIVLFLESKQDKKVDRSYYDIKKENARLYVLLAWIEYELSDILLNDVDSATIKLIHVEALKKEIEDINIKGLKEKIVN